MNRAQALLSAALILAAPCAEAQQVAGSVTLGYTDLSVDRIDRNTAIGSFDAALDVDFGNLHLGSTLSFQNLGVDDHDDFRTTAIALDAHYRFDNGLTAGAYAEQITLDAFTSQDLTSYGVSLGYAADIWRMEVFAGQTDLERGNTADDYGLIASVTPTDRLTLATALARTEVGGFRYALTRFAAVYALDDRWSAFGGIDATSGDLIDVRAWGIGVGYDLSHTVGRSAILSLELSRARVERPFRRDVDIETIEIGLTIPLGSRGGGVPLNSMAGKVLRPRHSAMSGIFDLGIGAVF